MSSMCPHCGRLFRTPPSKLIPPHHDTPEPGTEEYVELLLGPVCPGSRQHARCAESDGRPLWNGKSNPHFYKNTEDADK